MINIVIKELGKNEMFYLIESKQTTHTFS